MELVYTDSGLTKQGVLRDFALDMAYGDSENDFLLTMPLPQSKRYGADRDAVITEYEGDGSIVIEQANGSTLHGLEVDGKAERIVPATGEPYVEVVQGRNLFKTVTADDVSAFTSSSGSTRYGYVIKTGQFGHVIRASGETTASVNVAEIADGQGTIPSSYTLLISANGSRSDKIELKPNSFYVVYPATSNRNTAVACLNSSLIQLERGSIATPYVPYGALEFVTRGKNLWNPDGKSTNAAMAERPGVTLPAGTYTITNNSNETVYWRSPISKTTSDGSATASITKTFTLSDVGAVWCTKSHAEIQLEQGTTATPYEPYTETRTAIDTGGNVLASLPDGTEDKLTVGEDRHVQLVKRFGVVDLGSLPWTYNNVWFACTGLRNSITKKDGRNKGITAAYQTSLAAVADSPDKSIIFEDGDATTFYVKDSSYSDSDTFRAAMQGVLLYYELAEPQYIDLGFIDMPATYDGYTRLTIEASTPPTFRIYYEVSPATRSYLVEIVPELEIGALVYAHGTDIGGIVDTKGFDNTGDVPVMTYCGRTWHGMLDASITRPNSGQAYLTLTGDINTAINTLITRAGLGDVFSAAPTAGYTVSYQVPRYVSVWEALRRLCKQYGMRPQIERGNGKTVLGAVERQDYSNGSVSDLSMGLQFERMHRPVNHLVVLGQGELAARTVIDLYADADGNVSTTQTLFGSDEVAAVYENTSDGDASKLLNDGIEKLKEYQTFANVDMSLPSNEEFQIGDTVTAYSVEAGLVAAAEVVKKVVTVGDNGFAVTNYELGEPAVKAYR